jgi:hypothetical protein
MFDSPEFAATFGAMLLALVFAFLLLPFGLWIFVRPLLRRVRKASIEQTDGAVRANVELASRSEATGFWADVGHWLRANAKP